jgi:ABC-type lipoprotein release transport system permease subunit
MTVAVGIGVCFSVLLVAVSLGVSYDIKHRLAAPEIAHLPVGVHTIDHILTALTVVVTGSMLVQTAAATYTQGVNAMASRGEEIAIRRQSGVLRSTLVGEFMRSAVLACAVGGLAGVTLGVLLGLALRSWTVLPVRFSWLPLLGPFPVAVGVAVAATVIPAWSAANVSPTLLRRG